LLFAALLIFSRLLLDLGFLFVFSASALILTPLHCLFLDSDLFQPEQLSFGRDRGLLPGLFVLFGLFL
jgi:hypothetical protein